MGCVKYLLFFFNFLFAIAGIALITVGALVLKDVHPYDTFLKDSAIAPPIILIIAGSIVFFISFLGCCGAIRESYCKLMVFAVLLAIMLILELAVGIYAAVARENFEEHLKESMKYAIDHYDSTSTGERRLWAQIQSRLECCGVDGPSDWKLGGMYPASCCKSAPPMSEDLLCGPTKKDLFKEGCFSKLRKRIKDGGVIILSICIGIAVVQLVGIILAVMLAAQIKRDED